MRWKGISRLTVSVAAILVILALAGVGYYGSQLPVKTTGGITSDFACPNGQMDTTCPTVTSIACDSTTLNAGVQVTVTATVTGSVKIMATYSGDSSNLGSSGTLLLTII
ncbi:MAG: hypothetical protein OK422_06100 [Thaumarchaeota archaeon]|nr:hypothetical protein [Nitrososphaerota archaeon]